MSRNFGSACIRAVKWLPVLFITGVVSWSYYAYIVHLCIFTVAFDNGAYTLALFLVATFHIVLVPFLSAYWKTVWTKAGKVPVAFKLTPSEFDDIEAASDAKSALEAIAISKDVAVSTRSPQGEIRYCTDCSQIKPDRCHHCSVCHECVLKMDHHCPWVNNCVGFYNQKFFFLFLGYGLLYCFYISASTFSHFAAYWSNGLNFSKIRFHVLFLFFVSSMFSISLASLFGYHVFLISRNRTALESFRPPIFVGGVADKNGFNLGGRNNFAEVFGDRKRLWMWPVFSSMGDGTTFPRLGQNVDDSFDDSFDDVDDFIATNNRRFDAAESPEEQELLLSNSVSSWTERETIG